MGKVKVVGAVLVVAVAVAAPQAGWWLLSDERSAISSAEVEAAVRQELEIANELRLDRLECEPIPEPPGTSICDVQEADEISGLVYEVGKDGKGDLFEIETGDLTAKKAYG